MRTFGTILALLLIFFGLVVAGLVFVRIWQDNGLLRVDINTANVSAPPVATESAAESARVAEGGAVAATGVGAQPQVVGIESGGMSLGEQGTAAASAAPADQSPPVEPQPVEPQPTVDPCPPAAAEGFAADTAVVAVGMLRVYSQTDVTSPALRDLSAGQGLWIVAGEDGSTAIKRCEVIWQRVRTADGLAGWVLEDAIDVIQPTRVTPTAVPTSTTSPCVGGCGQQGGQPGCGQPCPTPCSQPCPTPCYQPCPTPCYQPCTAQPCTTPCGVYTQ